MKSITDWYQEFPEPYRTQALENYDPEYELHGEYDGTRADSVICGFDWGESRQGIDHWNEFHNILLSVHDNEPIPTNPTYEQLEQRVKELEDVLRETQYEIAKYKHEHKIVGHLGKVQHIIESVLTKTEKQ